MKLSNAEDRSNKIVFPTNRLNSILALILERFEAKSKIQRDQPIEWSLMHVFSCSQLAKIIALIRGLDPEIAGIAGAIHDLAIIETGIFENHGLLGEEFVQKLLDEYNSNYGSKQGFLEDKEINQIITATIFHTNKGEYSEDEMVELLKDIDAFDRYLHGKDTFGYYLERTNRVLKDLGLKSL